MSLDKKRWIILGACCLLNLSVGSLYAWSVFAQHLAERLNGLHGTALTTGDLAIVFTTANLLAPVTLIGGGYVNDRLGPKWVVLTGGVLFGIGMALTGFVTSVGAMMLTYGVVLGMGQGLVYGSTVGSSVKFFPDKRGLVGGLVVAFFGLGSVVVPPIASALIARMGVSNAMVSMGVFATVVVCLCAMLLQKSPDGYAPAGWNPKQETAALPTADKDWRQMLRDPLFYLMLLMLVCGGFFGLMTISQASAIARDMVGADLAFATMTVSILALFNAAGRVLCGFISDRIGRVNCLALALVIAIAALMTLYSCAEGTYLRFIISICAVGFCFGAFMGIYPGFTADVFGAKHNSVNYGVMFIGFSIAGVVGPVLMNNIRVGSGSYRNAFLLAAGIAALGLALSFVYRTLASRKKADSLAKHRQTA